jgi:phosphinothricin acetyltransferase
VLARVGQIVGYAHPCESRAAYSPAKETSVYVHHDYSGQGIGLALLEKLIDKARSEPIHVLIAGITLPNTASVALYEKQGLPRWESLCRWARNSINI